MPTDPPFDPTEALASLAEQYDDRAVREAEATRRDALHAAEHEAPAGEQNTAAWVEENGAAYLDINPGHESVRQLDLRDDLLIDIAAGGRVIGVERIGWLVMAADLVEVLRAVRAPGHQIRAIREAHIAHRTRFRRRLVCGTCRSINARRQPWPCATLRALDTACQPTEVPDGE